MATQMNVIYSSTIHGVGLFAGGPYHCAIANAVTATTSCMEYPDTIMIRGIEETADLYGTTYLVDKTKNLEKTKVFIFSGTEDKTVVPGVAKKAAEFYAHFGANIVSEFGIAAGHTFPTTRYGNKCEETGLPYVSNCGYDGALKALQTFYEIHDAPTEALEANLVSFDQRAYLKGASMADKGWIYIPTGCSEGKVCRLHVAFHGCQMGPLSDGSSIFAQHAGYNEVAEANDIVILYPQAVKSSFLPFNPKGCWDWWGYNDIPGTAFYDTNQGTQVKAIFNMIKDLTRGNDAEQQQQ